MYGLWDCSSRSDSSGLTLMVSTIAFLSLSFGFVCLSVQSGANRLTLVINGENFLGKVFLSSSSEDSARTHILINCLRLGRNGFTKHSHTMAYTRELKLTGCSREGQFTCDDGQCVKSQDVGALQPGGRMQR